MKHKSIYILLLSFLFFMAFGSAQALADATSENYNNYTYPMSVYKKPVVQPFSTGGASGQTESINPANGGLEITQTDLSLKGKNGLDFNLTRIYRTSDALLYEPGCVSDINYQPVIQGYYVTGTETRETYKNGILTGTTNRQVYFCAPSGNIPTDDPYVVMPTNYPDFTYSFYWPTSQKAQTIADNFNEGVYDTSVTTTSGNDTILTLTKYSDKQDFMVQMRIYLYSDANGSVVEDNVINYYRNGYNYNSINDKYFNLGTGWSFDLPYIEQRGNTDFYLGLGKRGVIHFTWDINYYDTWVANHQNEAIKPYSIPLNDVDGFGDLQLNYVIDKSVDPIHPDTFVMYFELKEKDGKTITFAHDGVISKISDRFGNNIQITHHDPRVYNNSYISQIIDSVGRTINITYGSNNVTIEVNDETNPSNNRVIHYNKAPCPFDSSKSVLSSVTDAGGRITQYNYDEKSGYFSFWKKDPFYDGSGGVYPDHYEILRNVIYPTGGKTEYSYNDGKYSYMSLGVSGCLQFYKVTERADYSNDGTKYNDKTYVYHNYFNGDGTTLEYDGYPTYNSQGVPGGYSVKTDVTDQIGNIETYTNTYINYSHNDLLCTDILSIGANHKKETINSYDGPTKLLTQSINRTFNKTTGAYIDKIENYKYDSLNNVLNYWDPQANGNTAGTEHETVYTYGPNSIMTSKTYKQDANTTIKEQYTLSPDGKTVTQAQVYKNGVLQKQTGYGYDMYGNVTEERDYLGNWSNYISTHYDYTDNDSARNGKFSGLYLTRKWVDGVKDADGNSVAAKNGNNSGTVDETYKYDWFGDMVQKQDGQGNLWSKTYDKLNRVTSEVNPDATSKTYGYKTNTTENSVLETDERGTQIKSGFDNFGNLIYTMDMASGQYLTHYTYDSLFRLITEDNNNTSHYSRNISYLYYSDGRKKQNLAKGNDGRILNEEDFSYDDANSNGAYNKTTKTVAGDTNSPSITTVTYANKLDKIEKQGTVHNGAELLSTFQYDYLGNKTQEKSARAYAEGWSQPYTTSYDYNSDGKPVKVYNVNGDYTTTEYDPLGRIIKVTDIKGNKASTPYSTTYSYDNLGRIIEEDIPFQTTNGTISDTIKKHYYDRNGNIILEKVSSNKPGQAAAFDQTGYEYNSRNQLTKVVTYTNGSPVNYTQYYYDADGNKVRMYTGLSQPLQIKGLDNVTASGDPNYSVTKYDYDCFNRLQTMTDPLGKQEQYVNDLNGNLVQKTDRNGSITTMTYDGLGRLLARNASNAANPQMNASYSYTFSITGNRTAMSGGGINAAYTYDDQGRLIKETDGSSIEKDYTYNTANNRLSFILKQNGQVKSNTTYNYDLLNRLWHVYENNSTTPTATYSYDDNGNRSSLAYSNGDTSTYQYNLANDLTQLSNNKGAAALSQYTYTYYLDGNQANKTDNTGKTNDYVYDGLGRLTSEVETVSGNTTSTTYNYDDANNRRAMTVTGPNPYTVNYDYDRNNRLSTESKVSGDVTQKTGYGYDDNGNQICSTTETTQPALAGKQEMFGTSASGQSTDNSSLTLNVYDGFNQLIGTTVGDKTIAYSYDGDGLRASKTVNKVTTNHIWDGQNIALETTGGVVTGTYLRGTNLIAGDFGGSRKYYEYNGHGDVVQLVDTSGNVTKSYDYDAFGNEKNIDPNDINVFRYSGEYYDLETNTYYLRARNYDPTTGRFLNEDTNTGKEKDPLSLNLYVYCYNNPILYFDSTGNQPEWSAKILASLKGTYAYNWVVDKTQKSELDWFYESVGFSSEGNGIYHANQDAKQQYFGYNKLYDGAFDLGTSMLSIQYDFSASGEQFRLWFWKGDYLNLGAGAEVGIYFGGGPEWLAGNRNALPMSKDYTLPMTLSLYDNNGNQIFSYDPGKNNWWITGFNSKYQNVQASNLTAYGTINFSGHLDMWDSFCKMYSGDSMWTFDTDNHIAKFTW